MRAGGPSATVPAMNRPIRVTTLAATIALIALAALPASGWGATRTVTKTADTNDGVCNSDCSFREALAVANVGDTVVVPAGTYKATMLGGNGAWAPDGQYTITGAGAGQTIIDGNAKSRTFAFYGQITVRGVTVTGGVGPGAGCTCGGGFEVRQGGQLTLVDSVVSGNSAGGGGGINVDGTSSATLRNVAVTQNSSTEPGGGINVDTGGKLNLENIEISANSVSAGINGAGLVNEGTVTAANVTVSGNTAPTGNGGGIFNGAGTLALNAATIAGNSAGGSGDGIRNAGTLTLRNTILAGNQTENCSGTATPAVTSLGHNLESGATCGFTGAGDVSNVDPLLGGLLPNGATSVVRTHALAAGSPAIDTGDAVTCPATDARGVARPQGAVCDIGAFELQPTTPSNSFSFGKVKHNKKKGTAKLTVEVPGAGAVSLAKSGKVSGADADASAAGDVKLKIAAHGGAKDKLADKGKLKVKAKVTFTPTGGTPKTNTKKLKLKLKLARGD